MPTTQDELVDKLHERLSEGDAYAERLAEAVRTWESLDASPHGLLDPNDTVLLSDAPTAGSVPWPTRHAVPQPMIDLAAVIDQLPDAVVLVDAGGLVKLWNAAATELFGWSGIEAFGMPPPFATGPHAAEHAEILEATRGDSPIRERIVSRRGKDGRAMLLTLITRGMADGDVLLTFRKLSSAGGGSTQPTTRLEALGRMVAGVSHDFNNVLAAIVGSADLLADRINIHHPDREWVEVIRAAGRHATGLTRRLIDFARPCPKITEDSDVGEIVQDLVPLLNALLPNGVRLKVQAEESLPLVSLDATAIEQIAINLATNAGQAMPRGGSLQIRTGRECRDGRDYVVLAVADSGGGIEPAVQSSLFHPFFTTRPGGTGLGLALVRDLAQQAGGFVEVDAITGLGTVFRVFLPITTRREPLFDATGLTALVADDDPGVCEVVKRTLESVGMNVTVAAHGDEAVRAARWSTESIDLLVTDVVMPGLGGRKLAERLRMVRPDLAVLFISSYPRVDEPLAPGTQFLAKPFLPKHLLAVVRELLPMPVG